MKDLGSLLKTAVLGLLFAGSASTAAATDDPATHDPVVVQIDHVILGVPDLESSVPAFEEATGVGPVFGGKHPFGTENALASLAERNYLELLAPQPGAESTPLTTYLAELTSPTPIGWIVSVSNLERLQEILSKSGFRLTEPKAGSRTTPSGSTLRWRSFQVEGAPPTAPDFIIWSPDTPHPASTSPDGCTLEGWTIKTPEVEFLTRLLEALDLAFEIVEAPEPAFTMKLSCPNGDFVYGENVSVESD